MRQFANWDQAVGFYTAHYDANSLHITPTIATQEHPLRLFATPPARCVSTQCFHAPAGPANLGSENLPIFVASTANTPIFVASTAGSPISVSSTAPTPVVAQQDATKAKFAPKVPKRAAPLRAQSVGTPTPGSRTLQPFPMPPPSPNLRKATPSPRSGRSYQCPTDSCRIPVIPVDSGGFRRNGNWQRALPILSFRLFLVPADSLRSGIDTGMFPGIHRNGMQPE